MTEYIERDGEQIAIMERIADDALGLITEEVVWFDLPEGWAVEGDTATALVQAVQEDGTDGPERYQLTMSIERITDDE